MNKYKEDVRAYFVRKFFKETPYTINPLPPIYNYETQSKLKRRDKNVVRSFRTG